MTVGSGLKGSFPLTKESIDKEVKFISAGVFALGVLSDDGKFQMLYVGRSDTDVRRVLKTYIGKANRFKFELFDDPEVAFRKECEIYHFMKPKANMATRCGPPNWIGSARSVARAKRSSAASNKSAAAGDSPRV